MRVRESTELMSVEGGNIGESTEVSFIKSAVSMDMICAVTGLERHPAESLYIPSVLDDLSADNLNWCADGSDVLECDRRAAAIAGKLHPAMAAD